MGTKENTMAPARELLEKIDALEDLKEAISKRMAGIQSKEEELEVNSLIQRAFNLECAFDRKHRVMLLALALAPHEVGWGFKVRERMHRLIHHH
jgi:hypothetical protein